jgi:uncharacterized protein YdeI (YjbR/CyaY-like superfamily)
MDFYKALGNNPAAKAPWSTLTANEKRDFSDWIEDAEDKPTRNGRIAEACAKLADGERRTV